MKNKFLALFTAVSIATSLVPQKSEAGLLIGALAGNAGAGAAVGGAIGAAWLVTGGVTGMYEGEWGGAGLIFLFLTPALAVTLLDVNASISPDVLAQNFSQALPFIDNQEVIADLAMRTKAKANDLVQTHADAQQIVVSFSESEIADVLGSTDLSQEQYQQVLQLLQ